MRYARSDYRKGTRFKGASYPADDRRRDRIATGKLLTSDCVVRDAALRRQRHFPRRGNLKAVLGLNVYAALLFRHRKRTSLD